MPTTSSLQNKTSDLVTKINYTVPKNFDVTLKNEIDGKSNINYSDLNVKKFINNSSEINVNYYEKAKGMQKQILFLTLQIIQK